MLRRIVLSHAKVMYPAMVVVKPSIVQLSMTKKNRQFFIYQGSSYSGDAPILFVLHGYTSRALWIMNYSGFQSIADEFGFLVIYPQGTLLPSTGQTHWNVGGWTT